MASAAKALHSENFVGFANLPNQVHRKIAKRGFEFTLMVIGSSGLGKSTLVNSLFLTDLYPDREIPLAKDMVARCKTVKIETNTVEIEEGGVRVKLTLVDTPGYNDSLNAEDCFRPIIEYIDRQFEKYLDDESGLNRKNICDNRVHCVLFFISPFGKGLRTIDIQCLQALQTRVNIVPLIGRADALTRTELSNLKNVIRQQFRDNQIKIYEIPSVEDERGAYLPGEKESHSSKGGNVPVDSLEQPIDDDAEFKEQNRRLRQTVPFAVCGSKEMYELKSGAGRRIRGRMYQWGTVDIECQEHCDFVLLRAMLTTHMQDLQELTHDLHYEQYRSERLNARRQMAASADHDQDRILREKEAELRAVQEQLERMREEMKQGTTGIKRENGET